MTNDISSLLRLRSGHFLLESGYHTNLWLDLDSLFVDPEGVSPFIEALAERLLPYEPSAVCGPLVGGAFLAQALASRLGLSFYYAESGGEGGRSEAGLFRTTYRLAPALREKVRGSRLAVVDDAVSAGSSVRATVAALEEAGAVVVVIGSLLLLGDRARAHFSGRGIPLESLQERELSLWEAPECPFCRTGSPLEDPRAPGPAQPRELIERFYEEIWNRHDRSKIPELLTDEVTFRGSLGPVLVGREAFASYVDGIHEALGSYRCDILDLVATDDRAFARMRFSGVHRRELLGHPPTGKRIEWAGAALFTFQGGRIADLWVLGDVHGLEKRLAVPEE